MKNSKLKKREAKAKKSSKAASLTPDTSHAAPAASLTNREAYLLGRPRERQLQDEIVEQIRVKMSALRVAGEAAMMGMVNLAEDGRQVGLLVLELEQMFIGKRITEDFWRQLPALFSDSTGQEIKRSQLEWLAKVARNHPEKIETVDEARRVWQPQLFAIGDPNFQLESERGPQVMHLQPEPISEFREWFDCVKITGIWDAVRKNPAYWDGGRLRQDLRETLRVKLEPTIKLVEEVKRELGL